MRYPLGSVHNGCAKYSGFSGGCKGPWPPPSTQELTPSEDQKTRRTLLPRCLGMVARPANLRPRPPPIIGALRRPFEIRRAQKPLQRPCRIIGNISDKAEFAAAPQ